MRLNALSLFPPFSAWISFKTTDRERLMGYTLPNGCPVIVSSINDHSYLPSGPNADRLIHREVCLERGRDIGHFSIAGENGGGVSGQLPTEMVSRQNRRPCLFV